MKISERLFGSPISGKVKRELNKRQNVLLQENAPVSTLGAIYEPVDIGIDKGGYNLNARTPFVRMWTSVKLFKPALDDLVLKEFPVTNVGQDAYTLAVQFQKTKQNIDGSNSTKIKPVYDKSGKIVEKYVVYKEDARDRMDYATQTYIVGDFNYQEAHGIPEPNQSLRESFKNLTPQEKAFAEDTLPDLLSNNPLMKPQAGITSISSTTKEFLGVTKETTVNFVVHNFADFDKIYNRFFLKPGAQIFIDFGFSDIDRLYKPEELIDSFDIQEFLYGTNQVPGAEDETDETNTKPSLIGEITRNEGSLEVIQGTVIDYNAKILKNGSVECSVTLMSSNSALLTSQVSQTKYLEIKNTLKQGVLFLGVAPTLSTVVPNITAGASKEDKLKALSDFERFLLTPDVSSKKENKLAYDKQILSLAVKKLNASGDDFIPFTPQGNAIRTGVYISSLEAEDVYVSWGFFEDIIMNENFGFGKDGEEINKGRRLNIRMDSSNSFTMFHPSFLKRQKALAEAPEGSTIPNYLYPETWGNGDDEELFTTLGPNSPGGSYNFQKGKYPSSHYAEIIKSNGGTAQVDKDKFRIPIREVFIKTTLISDAFEAAANAKGSVKDVIKFLLEDLNANCDDVFNWKMVSDFIGSEIKIIDNIKLQTLDGIDDFGIEGGTITGENSYFKNMFTFNIMSPNSIVKEYNLEFKLPSNDIGTMYAIQGMGSENNIHMGDQDIDNAVAISALDGESLGIQYRPSRGGYRAEEMAASKSPGTTTNPLSLYEDWSNLLESDVYNINTYQGTTSQYGEVATTIVSSAEINEMQDEPEPTVEEKRAAQLQKFRAANNKILINQGYRMVMSEAEYNRVITIQKGETTIVKRPNLLPFNVSVTIDGIATIQPGDTFRVDYLPEIYKRNVFCQTMNVTHNVNSDGWFTTLETAFRPLPDIKQVYYNKLVTSHPYYDPNYLHHKYFKQFNKKTIKTRKKELPAVCDFRLAAHSYKGTNGFDYSKWKNANEQVVTLDELSAFMTEIEDYEITGKKYIKKVFKFVVTPEINSADGFSSRKGVGDKQKYGFYNPAYHVARNITKTTSESIKTEDNWGILKNDVYENQYTTTREDIYASRIRGNDYDMIITAPLRYGGGENIAKNGGNFPALEVKKEELVTSFSNQIYDFFIPAPIILEPNNTYYLVVHETGQCYITTEDKMTPKHMSVFDRIILENLKYPHLNCQTLDEQIPKLKDSKTDINCMCCFIAGTKVIMSDGRSMNIEEIKIGDSVKTWDEKSDTIFESDVVELIQPIKDDMIVVDWGNSSNKNTFDHPYFVKDKGWSSYKPELTIERYGHYHDELKDVKQIEVGDIIYEYDNGTLKEVSINSIQEDLGDVQTYIIKLDKYHTFFANNVLTHNK